MLQWQVPQLLTPNARPGSDIRPSNLKALSQLRPLRRALWRKERSKVQASLEVPPWKDFNLQQHVNLPRPASGTMDSPHTLSDATVYAPHTRARLGTTAHVCKPAPGDDPEP